MILDHQEKFFKEVFFPYVDEHQIKIVINLGDSFDRRKYINYGTLNRAKKMFFDELAIRDIYSPTLIGNHDSHYKSTIKVNSINEVIVDKYPNVHMIDTPQTLDVGGYAICMIPWICAENEVECLEHLQNAATDICMGHFDIAGFVMHMGKVSEGGLDRNLFSRYDMVLSGHFHHRSSDGTITYLGTQYEMTWADYKDPKGFHILDLSNRQLDFIRNPYSLHHRIMYNEETPLTEIDFTQYKNSIVRVVVDRKMNSKKFDTFLELMNESNPNNLEVVETLVSSLNISDEIHLDQSIDTLSLLHSYLDHATITDDVDLDRLKSLFGDIYLESQQINVDE